MTWRDHTWEFVISAFSWIVAIGALVFVVAYVAHDTFKTRRRTRKRGTS
jgi:hypothetical protein